MIFTLLLSSVFAAHQQAMVCDQIFDPAYCTGPAAGAPGQTCQWDAQEYECKSVSNKLEDACKALSTNQAACNAKTGCHFDLHDFECKGAQEIHHAHGALPNSAATNTNALPNSHATATGFPASSGTGFNTAASGMNTFPTQPAANNGFNTFPTQPAANGFNTFPTQPAANGLNTFPTQPAANGFNTMPTQQAATGFNSAPTQPAAHNGFSAATGNTGAFPQANTGTVPQSGGYPYSTTRSTTPFLSTSLPATTKKVNFNSAVSTTLPHTTSGLHGKATTTTRKVDARNFCESLPQVQCFGPSMNVGRMCFWDAEDMECIEATAGNVEAICNQFARDPLSCDSHENCFWDAKDQECSELKGYGPFAQKPVLPVMCANFKNVNECASQSSCFWDNNVCINVIQASNVCSVLSSPQACSTNRNCHWRDNSCSIAQIPAPFAGLNFAGNQLRTAGQHHLRSAHQQEDTNEPSQSTDYLIMFACGFSGALLGLLFALAMQTMCQQKSNQEDDFYRDIVLDVHSHRRQVV